MRRGKKPQTAPKARAPRTLADFFHQALLCPPVARMGDRQQEQLAARDADMIATENYMDQEVVLDAVLPRLEDKRPRDLQITVPAGRWLQAASDSTPWPHTPEACMTILEQADTIRNGQGHRCTLTLYKLGLTTVTTTHLCDMAPKSLVGDGVISIVADLINATPGHNCYVTNPALLYRVMLGYPIDNYNKAIWDSRRYLLMPAPEPGHLTLCIADRQTRTLYRQDNLHLPYKRLIDPLLAFLSTTEGGSWTEVGVHPTRQTRGSNDCAPGVVAGMVYFVRQERLIPPSVYSGDDLSLLRGRIFAMLLFATLDPPTDLGLMAEGLRQLYLHARPRLEDFVARLAQMSPTEGSAHVDLTSPTKSRADSLTRWVRTRRITQLKKILELTKRLLTHHQWHQYNQGRSRRRVEQQKLGARGRKRTANWIQRHPHRPG